MAPSEKCYTDHKRIGGPLALPTWKRNGTSTRPFRWSKAACVSNDSLKVLESGSDRANPTPPGVSLVAGGTAWGGTAVLKRVTLRSHATRREQSQPFGADGQ